MSSKIKLGKLSSSKAVASKTFIHPKPSNHQQTRIIRYVTLDNAPHRPDYPSVINRLSAPRRNHTQNSKYIGKNTLHTNETSINGSKKRYSINSASKSLNLKSNSLEFRTHANEHQKEEVNREDRFAAMREEKIGRLKDLYALKNKNHKGHNSIKPNAKINSFGELPNRKQSAVSRNTLKEKLIFNKQQDFHSSPQVKQGISERHLPKYLDFCEDQPEQHSKLEDNRSVQNEMPRSLKEDHIIGKVKSIKTFMQSPPLVPVTFKRENNEVKNISLDWFLGSYQPHLEIFQDVAFEGFTMIKVANGVFFGETNQESGIPEGRGVFFYENGKIYEGSFKNGQKNGLGFEEYPDHSYYLGNFAKNRREGKGKFQWSNGEAYDGEWKDNKKSGSGIWKGQNGLSYVGQWQQDSIEGFGVLIEKGFRYEGEFKNFMKWGKGTLRFDNGQIYTGMFKQNLPNGTGDYYWTNQDHFHGDFANGKRHGEGVLKYSNGGVYRGVFQNDKKSGQGQQHYQDQLFYQGEFQNDLRHGWGVLSCDEKVIFEGYWINNSAVDPRSGKIDPIIQQQPSRLEKDTSKNSKMRKQQSNISQMRSKHLAQKQSRRIMKITRSTQKKEESPPPKKFQRACNCERHRQKRLQIQM